MRYHGGVASDLTIALTGDVMLGRLVDEVLEREEPAYVWGGMLPRLRAADLVLVNLECALTGHRERWHDHGRYKAFYFASDPRHAASLATAGVRLASLANNHVMDFGVEGMRETIDVLDRAGIAHAGAGPDLAAAGAPAVVGAGDARIAVVAFADHPAEWAAGPTAPGIAHLPIDEASLPAVGEAVTAARAQADLVIASFHWGPNMRARPTAEFRRFARGVVDAGADVFWGHSAHVVQGVEVRGGRAICYDTGDFVDDYAVDADLRNDLSALFLLRLRGSRLARLELLPVRIDRMRVDPAVGADRERFVRSFTARCAELGTTVAGGTEVLTIEVAPGP